jgi:hypothetical protein
MAGAGAHGGKSAVWLPGFFMAAGKGWKELRPLERRSLSGLDEGTNIHVFKEENT